MFHGCPASSLSTELYNFLTEWFSDTLFRDRRKFGPEYNGLELWRRLHNDFEGNGTLVEDAGFLELQHFARCSHKSALAQHIHDWQEMFNAYGTQVTPERKRLTLLNGLPREMMEELGAP